MSVSVKVVDPSPSSDAARPFERIVLACAPKSGSTFIARVLARYFNVTFENPALSIDWAAEQNITPDVERQVSGSSFVLQLHLLPREINLNAMTRLGASTVFSWRNLGDVLVSYDDHLRNEDHRFPTFYVHDRARYLAMSDQERYQYLIRYALPWYLAFYLGWREHGVVFRPYEAMVAEPLKYFSAMIEAIEPGTADIARLQAIIDHQTDGTRLNAGVAGRSRELFSPETKRMLEDVIISHPEHERLGILLHELPWAVPGLIVHSEYDGRLLRDPDSLRVYFIDRGRKHYVASSAWVLSRWPGRAIEDVDVSLLADLAEGQPLS
jgi:hypothetical protein